MASIDPETQSSEVNGWLGVFEDQKKAPTPQHLLWFAQRYGPMSIDEALDMKSSGAHVQSITSSGRLEEIMDCCSIEPPPSLTATSDSESDEDETRSLKEGNESLSQSRKEEMERIVNELVALFKTECDRARSRQGQSQAGNGRGRDSSNRNSKGDKTNRGRGQGGVSKSNSSKKPNSRGAGNGNGGNSNNNNNNNNNNGNDGNNGKKGNGSGNGNGKGAQENDNRDDDLRFACPFLKSKINCVNRCFKKLKRMHHVVRHVKEEHTGYGCPRCCLVFRELGELRQHCPQTCAEQPQETRHLITEDRFRDVKQKMAHARRAKKAKKKSMTPEQEEQEWTVLFESLFPGRQVPDPYLKSRDAELIDILESFMQNDVNSHFDKIDGQFSTDEKGKMRRNILSRAIRYLKDNFLLEDQRAECEESVDTDITMPQDSGQEFYAQPIPSEGPLARDAQLEQFPDLAQNPSSDQTCPLNQTWENDQQPWVQQPQIPLQNQVLGPIPASLPYQSLALDPTFNNNGTFGMDSIAAISPFQHSNNPQVYQNPQFLNHSTNFQLYHNTNFPSQPPMMGGTGWLPNYHSMAAAQRAMPPMMSHMNPFSPVYPGVSGGDYKTQLMPNHPANTGGPYHQPSQSFMSQERQRDREISLQGINPH